MTKISLIDLNHKNDLLPNTVEEDFEDSSSSLVTDNSLESSTKKEKELSLINSITEDEDS